MTTPVLDTEEISARSGKVPGMDEMITALHNAAANGDCDRLRELLSAGVDVDACVSGSSAALSLAASEGRTDAVRVLLENGADVNKQNKYGNTPMMFAITRLRTDALQTLLSHGANPDLKNCDNESARDLARITRNEEILSILKVRDAKQSMAGIIANTRAASLRKT